MAGEEHAFKVDLAGLIHLLSDHLYEQPMAFLRELMQNAVDAITTRQFQDVLDDPKITCELIFNGDQVVFTFADNGIGLTESQIHEFLATIAKSSKRGDLAEGGAFIGQFGVGFLSCFIVADEVRLFTKSVQSDQAYAWTGYIDGRYELVPSDYQKDAGTTVHLTIKNDYLELFDPEVVGEWILRYGGLLPFKIYMISGDDERCMNPDGAPWNKQYANASDQRDEYMQFAATVLDTSADRYAMAFDFRDPDGQYEAMAVVLNHPLSSNARLNNAVYLKGMFINELEDLSPDWAFFIQVIVNARNLTPTASREGVREDEQLLTMRESIDKQLRHWLINLVNEQPELAELLISIHHANIRHLAADDEGACQALGALLPVETSMGVRKLKHFIDNKEEITYVPSVDEFRQFRPVASAENNLVVNAGYQDVEPLLKMFAYVHKLPIRALTGADFSQDLGEAPLDDQDRVSELEAACNRILSPFSVSAEVRDFQPSSLTALVYVDERAWQKRQHEASQEEGSAFSGLFNAFDMSSVTGARLLLNWQHDLIKRLIKVENFDAIELPVKMIYVQSMLQGHHPLSEDENKVLDQGISTLIETLLDDN